MALDAARIERAIRKGRKLLKKAPRTPTPEQVHDFRTNVRRLETTVQTLSLDTRRNERRVLRAVGQLRKRADKLRDMDVLTACVAELDVASESDCRVQLLEYLGAERYRHATKVHAALSSDGGLRRRLKRTCRRVQKWADGGAKKGDRRAKGLTDVMATALGLAGDLAVPARLDGRTLHPYRLKVKEVRDVLQLASSANDQRFVETLGDVKDAIGEWHDWEELIAIAAEVLDHDGCRLVQEAKRTSHRKFERALKLTIHMRRRCLPTPSRGRHPSPAVAGTPPVLEATKAIAG